MNSQANGRGRSRQEPPTQRRVAIIGAGVSGLAAIKACLEEGLLPCCFEKNDESGGSISLEGRTSSGVFAVPITPYYYHSKSMSCFSDYPYPPNTPLYPHWTQVQQYLLDYMQHFDLERYILYETRITAVSRTVEGTDEPQWSVTMEDMEGGGGTTELFDDVIVCAGPWTQLSLPSYTNMDQFTGEVIHSSQLCSNLSDFIREKNVMIVGCGSVAGDLAVTCARYARHPVYLSAPGGTWVIPRYIFGNLLHDEFCNQRFYLSATTDVLTTLQTLLTQTFDLSMFDLDSHKPLWKCLPDETMVNDVIHHHLMVGEIEGKPQIASFTETGAVFSDRSVIQHLDLVIFTTGQRHGYPFIDKQLIPDDLEDLRLYNKIFNIDVANHSLAVIGLLRSDGPKVPLVEMQARYAASVFSGRIKLPKTSAMLAEIQRRNKIQTQIYGAVTYKVNYVHYMDELARAVGVFPGLTVLLRSPAAAFECLSGPVRPFQYRIRGVHSWTGAFNALNMAPILNYPAPRNRYYTARARMATLGLLVITFIVVTHL